MTSIGFLDCYGAKPNVLKTIGVEDFWTHHSCLHVLAIFWREARIQHLHGVHIDDNAYARRRGVVKGPVGERCFDDVVISKCPEQPGLEHADCERRPFRVDSAWLRIARAWGNHEGDSGGEEDEPGHANLLP
jgi:hypothetical protein